MGAESLLKKIKVLYVEDESITRTRVCKFLKKRLGKVILAENGEDGIKNFLEYRPDVIITDLIMPDMSGIEMMRKLRNAGHNCPFIITSAVSDTSTILKTVDLKIENYLLKPIDVDILVKNLTKIATKILEERKDLVVVNEEYILTEEARGELELQIRNIYAKYLKKVTGKGAKLIQVFLKGKEIEIVSKENLTTLEENLLNTGAHHKTVEVIRKTIYESSIYKIENEIESLINRKVVSKKIEIFPKEKYERVLLKII